MPRYYFDIRDGESIAVDEEGLELPDLRTAAVEAAQSLAEMAEGMPPGTEHHHRAIEVRLDHGPLFQAAFIFEVTRMKQ